MKVSTMARTWYRVFEGSAPSATLMPNFGLPPRPPAAQTSKVPSSWAMKPRSLKVAWVSFLSELEKVTFSFLGSLISVMMSSR